MSEPEYIVARVSEGKVDYELHFTATRIVGLHSWKEAPTWVNAVVPGAITSLARSGVNKSRQSKWEAEGPGLSLDERVAADKLNFSVAYSDTDQIGLWLGFSGYSCAISAVGVRRTFAVKEKEFKQLLSIVPQIPAISGKVDLPRK